METVGDAIGGNVATKTDIDRVETTLRAEISEVRTDLKADIAEVWTDVAQVRTEVANVRAELKADIGGLEARLYRQLWLMAVGIVGLTVALVKLLG